MGGGGENAYSLRAETSRRWVATPFSPSDILPAASHIVRLEALPGEVVWCYHGCSPSEPIQR